MNALQQLFEQKDYKHTTDKGSVHTYLERYYGKEFEDKREQPISLLEIGVFMGGSLALFSEFMPKATIVGVDVDPNAKEAVAKNVWGVDMKNVSAHTIDAYTEEALDMFEDNSFDYIIDDGPHTLDSMIFAVYNWFHKVKEGGKLIIEGGPTPEGCEIIRGAGNKMGAKKITIFDLRTSEGSRYDDIIIEIQK